MYSRFRWQILLVAIEAILTIANMQFGQEMVLVMQTMHAQRWQYLDRVDKHCFLPLKMHTGITKTLEFGHKTDMF